MFKNINCVDVDSIMHLVIREGTWYFKIGWNLNARYAFKNQIPVMAIGKQKGKVAALAVQREKYEFVHNARHGPLKLVICTPDPAGHGGITIL